MKKLTLIFALSLLVGCAVSPLKKYPNIVENYGADREVTLVFDMVMLYDVKGSDPGVNINEIESKVKALAADIVNKMSAKGYKIDYRVVTSGEFLDYEVTYIDYDQDVPTGKFLEKPLKFQYDQDIYGEGGKEFLDSLMLHAKKINSDKGKRRSKKKAVTRRDKKKQQKAEEKRIAKLAPPDQPMFVNQNIDLLMVIRSNSAKVGMGKSIGTGIATGLFTAVLTGGLVTVVSMPVSGAELEFVIYDTKKQEVIWFQSLQAQGGMTSVHDSAIQAVSEMVDNIPDRVPQ